MPSGMNHTEAGLEPFREDQKALEKLLPGRIGAAASDLYESGRTVFSRFGRLREPSAVIRPATSDEVATVLRWAQTTRTRLSIRSGGHSFDGFPIQNDVVLLDLSGLNRAVMKSNGKLHAMPGATVADVAKELASAGRALPHGDCPVVGFGGLLAGGGFGYASRHWGLALDFLEQATIVTPGGETLIANADSNADLFWACRGGMGCAGIATELVMNTVSIGPVTGMTIGWRWAAAGEAITLFSSLLQTAPTTLDLKLKIRSTGSDRFIDEASDGPPDAVAGTPLVHIDGQFLGAKEDAAALLEPLLTHDAVLNPTLREETYYDAMLQLIPLAVFTDAAPATHRPMRVASDFSRGIITNEEAAAIVHYVDVLQNAPEFCGGAVLIEPANGKLASIGQDQTAFAHRSADLLFQWELFNKMPADEMLTSRQSKLLTDIRQKLDRVITGGRYVNYADMLDTPDHWWGANLDKLRAVAARYDPDRILISRLYP